MATCSARILQSCLQDVLDGCDLARRAGFRRSMCIGVSDPRSCRVVGPIRPKLDTTRRVSRAPARAPPRRAASRPARARARRRAGSSAPRGRRRRAGDAPARRAPRRRSPRAPVRAGRRAGRRGRSAAASVATPSIGQRATSSRERLARASRRARRVRGRRAQLGGEQAAAAPPDLRQRAADRQPGCDRDAQQVEHVGELVAHARRARARAPREHEVGHEEAARRARTGAPRARAGRAARRSAATASSSPPIRRRPPSAP